MFTTDAMLLPFFSLVSLPISMPTGIKFFNWTGHLSHIHLRAEYSDQEAAPFWPKN